MSVSGQVELWIRPLFFLKIINLIWFFAGTETNLWKTGTEDVFPAAHYKLTCVDVLSGSHWSVLYLIVSVGTWGPFSPQLWAACSLATDDSCGPGRAALWPRSSGPRCSLWNGHEPKPRPGVIVLSGSWIDGSAPPLPPSSSTGPGHQNRLLLLPPSSPLTSPASRLLLSCAQFNFLPISSRAPATAPGGRSYDRLCPLYL